MYSLTPLRSTILRYLRWGRRGGRRNLRRWTSRWWSSVSGKLHKLCSRDFSQYYRETQANRAVLCGYRVRRVAAGESHQRWVVIQTKVFFCHACETHARHTLRECILFKVLSFVLCDDLSCPIHFQDSLWLKIRAGNLGILLFIAYFNACIARL